MRFPRARIFFVAILLSASAVMLGLPGKSGTGSVPSHSYLGFDLNEYPGDDALPILRKTFFFSSYWLGPPPGQKRTTWSGKRSLLQSQGLGFVVLFNGRLTRTLKSLADAHAKGTSDGDSAAKLARAEGFPEGTVIFLDIEEGGRLTENYHQYVRAWIDTLEQTHFHAGVYCSGIPVQEEEMKFITTAQDLLDHLAGRKLTIWIYNDACPPSPGCVFPPRLIPLDQSGTPAAAVWQYAQSPRRKEITSRCAATYATDGNCYAPGDTAHKWWLDANVADSPDPSAPKK
jgi:hypothetical protein